jgi:hypothetical protein
MRGIHDAGILPLDFCMVIFMRHSKVPRNVDAIVDRWGRRCNHHRKQSNAPLPYAASMARL